MYRYRTRVYRCLDVSDTDVLDTETSNIDVLES